MYSIYNRLLIFECDLFSHFTNTHIHIYTILERFFRIKNEAKKTEEKRWNDEKEGK